MVWTNWKVLLLVFQGNYDGKFFIEEPIRISDSQVKVGEQAFVDLEVEWKSQPLDILRRDKAIHKIFDQVQFPVELLF